MIFDAFIDDGIQQDRWWLAFDRNFHSEFRFTHASTTPTSLSASHQAANASNSIRVQWQRRPPHRNDNKNWLRLRDDKSNMCTYAVWAHSTHFAYIKNANQHQAGTQLWRVCVCVRMANAGGQKVKMKTHRISRVNINLQLKIFFANGFSRARHTSADICMRDQRPQRWAES